MVRQWNEDGPMMSGVTRRNSKKDAFAYGNEKRMSRVLRDMKSCS